MAELRLRGIRKEYGDTAVVQDLDLTVADGEVVCLLGPSGCGKSTILNIVAGLIEPTRGDVEIDGARVTDHAPKDRGIAMVFQDYALYPHMSVFQNLAFPLKAIRMEPQPMRERIEEVAALLDIHPLLHRLPRELSGGQRQRVALGRAIVRNPKVFLMDEPLSNLDARLRIQMRAELKRFRTRVRTTTIYVTHDQTEAMTLSDRIAILDRGVLQQVGPPLEVYGRPATRFVASFMGAMPMNFIDGAVAVQDGHPVITFGATKLRVSQVVAGGATLPAGRRVTLGIRPEDVRVTTTAEEGIEACLEMTEHLGADIYAYFQLGGGSLVVRLSGDDKVPLSSARIVLDPSKVHIFDYESGERLA